MEQKKNKRSFKRRKHTTQTPPKPAEQTDSEEKVQGETDSEVEKLAAITEELTRYMEKSRIAEYIQYLEHPGRMLWTNFLIGIARGLGSTIGLALVLGLFFYIIQKIIMLNLPGISDAIADFIIMIQENYHMLK